MLTSWIELITAATLLCDSSKSVDSLLYSETDESDSEKSKSPVNEKSGESLRKFGSLKKTTSGKSSASTQSGSSSLDRKWFFNKANSIYKNSLPVPTAQFRSYRKIPSTNIAVMGSMSTGNFTSHIPDFSPRFETQTSSQSETASSSNLATELPKTQESELSAVKPSKTKQKPLNYVHASNPNLCDISDFHLRSFHKLQPFQQCSDNLAGFVTLEELMNRQTEEQKLNPHAFNNDLVINPSSIRADVVYGVVPIRPSKDNEMRDYDKHPSKKPTHSRTVSDCSECGGANNSNMKKSAQAYDEPNSSEQSNDSTSFCFGKRGSIKKHKKDKEIYDACTYPKTKVFEEKLNRSLPRTHKLKEEFHAEDSLPQKSKKQSRRYSGDRKPFVSKEYSVSYVDLKDQSCEMVYCPQTLNDVHFAQNRTLDGKSSQNKLGKITRQHSLTSVDKKQPKSLMCGSSTEKLWIDSLRKSDKVSDKSSADVKLKSAVQYTPMSLPLVPDHKGKLNPKFAFELNLDEKVSRSGKFKNFFGKQTESKKEKTFLGSPKLHRAAFDKYNRGLDSAPLGWPPDPTQFQPPHTLDSCYSLDDACVVRNDVVPPLHSAPAVDYPDLEYPPVFEPETYSLSDPQCSITLLRKQDKSN